MLGLLVRQLQFFTPFLKFHRQLAHFFQRKFQINVDKRRFTPEINASVGEKTPRPLRK